MDVSQLCSNYSDDSSSAPSTKASSPKKTTLGKDQQYMPLSNFESVLDSYERVKANLNTPLPQLQTPKQDNATSSIESVLNDCSALCEGIWQLKLRHKTASENEREILIDTLSESAMALFQVIVEVSDCSFTKENRRKRDINNFYDNNNDDNDYDNGEEEEDDEDESIENNEEPQGENITTTNGHAEYELIRQARNLQNKQLRPRYRRRNRRNMTGQKCHSCGTMETPEWRRGPDGARTLCNACGLHYSKLLKKGSISVQTKNYLLTGAAQISSNSPELNDVMIRNNYTLPALNNSTPTVTNFPFMLIDPKYEIERRIEPSKPMFVGDGPRITELPTLSQAHSPYTQADQLTTQLPPLRPSSNDNDPSSQHVHSLSALHFSPSTLNINNSNTNSSNTKRNSTANNQNSINPLRIHQWKQNDQ